MIMAAEQFKNYQKIEDYIYNLFIDKLKDAIQDCYESVFYEVTDNLCMEIYSKFRDYDPDWCDESGEDYTGLLSDWAFDNAHATALSLADELTEDLFKYYDDDEY